ncbi:MAG: Flp family type IVb pilin, partial [Candidatus Omnitrophota bacterium]
MLRCLRKRKGQSLVEYALILGAIIVAILFMQLYVSRAISGRLKAASDDIGDAYSPSATMNIKTNRSSKITEKVERSGKSTTTYDYDNTTRRGYEKLPAANAEF